MANPTYISNLSRPRLTQLPISAARLRNAFTQPFTLVPIPHADQILLPESLILEFTPGTAYSGAVTLSLIYGGGGLTITTFADLNVPTLFQYSYPLVELGAGTPADLSGMEGRSLRLVAAADRTTGTGTALATLIYRVKKLNG